MIGSLNRRWFLVLLAAAAVLLAVPAQARHRKPQPQPGAAAGAFDYYVVSLSWSPQHCATGSRGMHDPQCGLARHYGFVLHGLWPQYERGYPQSCAAGASLSRDVVDGMLDVMPSPDLVRHEWSKHGTCSGLTPETYFATARRAYTAVQVPAAYRDPPTAFQTSVGDIEQAFHHANPDIDPGAMAVLCSGRFLQEVRVCVDRDLRARGCSRDVRDTCDGSITVRPIR
jgi:ribonuclease T2